MKLRIVIFAVSLVLLLVTLSIGQESSFRENALIKGIDLDGGGVGLAYTGGEILITQDNGTTWRTANLQIGFSENIAGVYFRTNRPMYAVIANRTAGLLYLATSISTGASWERMAMNIPAGDILEADLSNIAIDVIGNTLRVSIRLASSSNFERRSVYLSADSGLTWELQETVESVPTEHPRLNGPESKIQRRQLSLNENENVIAESVVMEPDGQAKTWFLTQTGICYGHKTGCTQETNIRLSKGIKITPPQISELAEINKTNARRGIDTNKLFSFPPGGTTRISLNRGFDKCQAGSIAQMQLWWDNSPLYDSNIYFSGRNRACASQPVNTTWINQVTAMGWGLIPTVVGYQSPCTAGTTTAKLSYDPLIAETQGRGEADIAVTDATNIGLTSGSVLYYDMERYDPPTPDTLGCRAATVAFLKGWTGRVKELGYKSGVYGSPKNAQEDWAALPPESKMDVVWLANWGNTPTVWVYPSFPTFPTTEWANHQRIKQWQAPHNETWGGVTFNIDGNIADAPVAGLTVARNKDADFDGDGKTDVSVFRPANGVWYVQNSSNSSVGAVQFGVATDSIVPRDYDGDGKTDQGVFRSADGAWYTMTKSGIFAGRQFGLPGDIPAVADFNGDGKADIAVFRPSNGVWYVANSDSIGSFTFTSFGLSGDLPVPGDYDGDGKADIAVYRPSNGVWYIRRSTAGDYAIQFGNSTDRAVPADYDGDGKQDVAIYRPSQGAWYIVNSSNGAYLVTVFGLADDIPVAGDYDGDGRADVAIFRPANGQWWLNRTTSGLTVTQFGITGDKPAPNVFGN